MSIDEVWVVVPAHDEEQLLGRCLTSVRHAVARLHLERPRVVVRQVVALDRCRDASAVVCARHDVDIVTLEAGNVGAARAAGIEHCSAVLRDADAGRRTWIANTDADSQVPGDWLLDQVRCAEAGADLVLGRVEPERSAPALVLERWHRLHPVGGTVVHGAHLGVRLSAYVDVGGFASLAVGEDVDLVDRLGAAGARHARASSVVLTSSRLVGRARGGFASFLAALVDPQAPGEAAS